LKKQRDARLKLDFQLFWESVSRLVRDVPRNA
jgi:hypothetical protein